MTLTTEQLRARAKFWREKAVEVKWESVSIAQDMLQNADAFDELAANREAQSVEIGKRSVFTCSSCGAQGLDEPLESRCHCMGDGAHWVESALYTAPPAPANAQPVAWEMRYWNSGYNMWHDRERITAEQHTEMSMQHAADNDYEFRVLYDAPPPPGASR